MASILTLPEDILAVIVSWVPSTSLRTIPFVCRKFNRVFTESVSEEVLHRVLGVRPSPLPPTLHAALNAYCKGLFLRFSPEDAEQGVIVSNDGRTVESALDMACVTACCSPPIVPGLPLRVRFYVTNRGTRPDCNVQMGLCTPMFDSDSFREVNSAPDGPYAWYMGDYGMFMSPEWPRGLSPEQELLGLSASRAPIMSGVSPKNWAELRLQCDGTLHGCVSGPYFVNQHTYPARVPLNTTGPLRVVVALFMSKVTVSLDPIPL